MAMRLKGTLVDWKDDRGFGFIEPAEGGARIFCHLKAFEVRVRRPMPGDKLTYEVGKDAQGRVSAVKVRPVGLEEAQYQANTGSRRHKVTVPSPSSDTSAPRLVTTACVFSSIFLTAVVWLVVVGRASIFVPAIYVVMSGITMFAYAFDKSAAMNDRRRTPEQTLHLLELFGGWPGGLISQQLFRHKSRKLSFRVEFWLCVIVNVAVLVWYVAHI